MIDLAHSARRLSPRLSSTAFDDAFRELSAARLSYEDVPRDPRAIAPLARASVRLEEARDHMHATLHGRSAA